METTAILKEDVYSYIKKNALYAKKFEVVKVAEIKEHVALVIKSNGDWFPVNVNKLIIQ